MLQGERTAQRIIKAARDDKASKLKEAQFEAKAEIEIIKKKLKVSYDEYEAKKE